MISLFNQIKNIKKIIFLVFTFLIFILHILLFYGDFHFTKSRINDFTNKISSDIDVSLIEFDIFRLRELVSFLKDDQTEFINFKSDAMIKKGYADINIGIIDNNKTFLIESSLPVYFNGRNLGTITFGVDFIKYSYLLFNKYLGIYVFLILLFALIAFISGFIPLLILRRVELLLNKVSEINKNNISFENIHAELISTASIISNSKHFSYQSGVINNFINTILEYIHVEIELTKMRAITQLASQVSHDIRSPLAALNMTIANLKDIPEQQRITLRAASNRINDIANTLLTRAKDQKSETDHSGASITNQGSANSPMKLQVELLSAILDTIVSEKRVQYRDKMQVEIEADFKNAYGAFANVNPMELSRVVSNLINNSVEALPDGKGKFTLSVVKESNQVVIIAQDNGKGIPAHILEKLGQMGVTHGKEGTQSGSGLGVYHAKSTIEQFGGQFEIQSTPNVGTKIIMTLPLAPAPKWFVEKIKIAPQSQIISLDDDLSIHNVWKGRFQSLGLNQNEITHLTFTSGIDFKDWVNNQPVSQSKNIQQRLYLIDYELLNQKQTGLDIIEELGIGSQSILVTSRYEELNIRERCEKLGVQLIPKGMAGLVPIELKQPLKRLDAILIDDDPLMGYVWTETAKTSNKSFEWFNDPELFFATAEQYDKSVEIYIDVSLAKNVKGQDVAIKLSQMGFANLHLATGYEADSVDKPSVVKTVIGKDCPL